MKESIARFTTTEFRRTQPFYYYALIIAGGFFAWSILLPGAVRLGYRERRRLSRPDRLFAVWALVVVVFFSLSQSKLPGYILTGVVALGVLVARVFAEAQSDRESPAWRLIRRSGLTLAWVAGGLTLPRWLTDAVVTRFGPLLPSLAMTLTGLVLLGLGAYVSRCRWLALSAYLAFPVALLTVNFDWVPRHAAIKSARALRDALPADLPPDTEFACDHCMPHGLPFYLGKPMTVFTEDGRELTSNYVLFSLASGKPWPEHLVPAAREQDYLAARTRPIYLLARGHRREQLEALARPYGGHLQTYDNDYIGTLLPAGGH